MPILESRHGRLVIGRKTVPRKKGGNHKAPGSWPVNEVYSPRLFLDCAISFTILLDVVWMSVGCLIPRSILRDFLHVSALLHRFGSALVLVRRVDAYDEHVPNPHRQQWVNRFESSRKSDY